MASSTTSPGFRKPRFKPVNLDPLSRVIYTQALTALKPFRAAKLDDPKPARAAVYKQHHAELSTLVSTVSAADDEGLSGQQKLALNLGKLTALFSKRLVVPLNSGARPTVPTETRKREVAPASAPPPEKKIKEEPLDEDEACCSTAASTNETLSSLLAAQLGELAAPPKNTVARPVTVARRAAPGAPPVKVVVANRNGAAARVVAVRRPAPGQTVAATAIRPTVPANQSTITVHQPTVPAVAPAYPMHARHFTPVVTRPPVNTKRSTVPTNRSTVSAKRSATPTTLRAQVPLAEKGYAKGKLSKRLAIHPDACYGIRERDHPEKHPSHACPYCGLMVTGAERLEHVKETHPDRYIEFTPFLCILMECDYRTTSRGAVRAHCMQVHSPLFDKWEATGRFLFDKDTVCPLCDDPVPVRSIKQLRQHVRAAHDTMPAILCGSCCETCSSTSELFLHWVNSPFCDGNAKLLDCRQESFLALFN